MLANEIINKFNKYKHTPDDDNIKLKNTIKESLMECDELFYAIHNQNLIDYSNTSLDISTIDKEAFFGKDGNIKPYAIIPETQTSPTNYVCYNVAFKHLMDGNSFFKYGLIRFEIYCDYKDLDDYYTGIARHDLIASIIREKFNWTNIFGLQVSIVKDIEEVTNKDYACRTLIFELPEIRNAVKTTDGVTRIINNNVVTK